MEIQARMRHIAYNNAELKKEPTVALLEGAAEIERLNLVIAKHKEVINNVERIVFGNMGIPVEVRERIQQAIYQYVTIDAAKEKGWTK